MDTVVSILTGTAPYHAELRTFGMALEGAMKVRNGPNKEGKLPWFYAYCLVVLTAFAGGLFGFLWMGKPSSLITGGDVTLTLCAIALVITTFTPNQIGYQLASLLPVKVVYTIGAQLFRALGTLAFINTANAEVTPSKYYPTCAILGPVLYGVLLGNMGPIFAKGVHGHLEKGMPWPAENGLVIGLFYQLFVNDQKGPIGQTLRSAVHAIGIQGTLDDKTFATVCVSVFMIVTGILMMPEFYGPGFYPFAAIQSAFVPAAIPTEAKKVEDSTEAESSDEDQPKKKKSGKGSKQKTT